VLGRNAQELQIAVNALVLGKLILAGSNATVSNVDIGPPRKPYDAPKWLPVDRPVQFKEIIANPDLLQVQGGAPDPVRIDMHVPADLFAWNGRGVPLDLRYRYNTAPSVANDSSLSIAVNGLLVKSFHLRPSGADEDKAQLGQLRLPILSDGTSGASNAISIPAFRVGSDNQLQLKFTMDSQKTGVCSGVANNPSRAAIDPDSTIDFSGFAHHALMPNLAFFANSGFPFTTYADLAQTLVVIPDEPTSSDIESVLALMGEMGKWTGFPSLRVQVAHASEVKGVINKDIIVVGSGATTALMKDWGSIAPVQISAASGPAANARYRFTVGVTQQPGMIDAVARSNVLLSESGSFGALIGFQSPYAKYRSVVALAATDSASLGQVIDALQNPGAVSRVQGDLTIVRGQDVQGQRIGPQYLVGDFPWYARVWMVAIKYPLALAVLGVLAGILVAIGAFLSLQALASWRRGCELMRARLTGHRLIWRGWAVGCLLLGPLFAQAAVTQAAQSGVVGVACKPWPRWETFKAQFISPDGRVIDVGSVDTRTVSEGQAYGLFFALVAGDKPVFEKLLNWTQENLAAGDLTGHLPSWLWGQKEDGSWGRARSEFSFRRRPLDCLQFAAGRPSMARTPLHGAGRSAGEKNSPGGDRPIARTRPVGITCPDRFSVGGARVAAQPQLCSIGGVARAGHHIARSAAVEAIARPCSATDYRNRRTRICSGLGRIPCP